MMDWSFRAFTLFGIPVRIHWTLLLIAAVYLLRPLLEGGSSYWFAFTAAGLGILFVQVLAHELGHCWAALRVGQYADQIVLWPLGGLAYVGHSEDPREDMFITIWGPAVNVFFGLAAIGAIFAAGMPWHWHYLNPLMAWALPSLNFGETLLLATLKISIVLAAFNLLVPAYPLDGGRILLGYLTLRHGPHAAMRLSARISIPIGCVLTVWGFLQGDLFLILLGIWVVIQAYHLKQTVTADDVYTPRGYSDRGYVIEEPRREGYFERRRRMRRERDAARRAQEEMELRRRVDELLDKVSREGIGSLTPEERRVLEDASERLRDRG